MQLELGLRETLHGERRHGAKLARLQIDGFARIEFAEGEGDIHPGELGGERLDVANVGVGHRPELLADLGHPALILRRVLVVRRRPFPGHVLVSPASVSRQLCTGRTWKRTGIMTCMPAAGPRPVAVELNAVLVALIDDEPKVLTLEEGSLLPSGPFETDHPTLQTGVRAWVERQTHHPLGYI